MTLYLYKTGTSVPMLTIENASAYTDSEIQTEDGTVYGPLGPDYELSSLPDCSETLRADWQAIHPSQEKRMEELEALIADLLFGGNPTDGGDTE